MTRLPTVYLTLDLGTTRLKAAAFDGSGQLLSQLAERHAEYRQGDRVWQKAADWWRACVKLVPAVVREARIDVSDIAALGVSGRGGAAVFVDAEGNTVADPWADTRHSDFFKERLRETGMSRYAAQLLAKFDWLQSESSSSAARVRYALFAKDYLVHQLTGAAITDRASGPDGPEWPAGSPIEQLPIPRLPWELAGQLTQQAAVQLALPSGIPVAVGAHDGVAANIGAGATRPRSFALTLGTHAVVRTISETTPRGARRFYGFDESAHIIGGNALAAGRSLDWFVDSLTDQTDGIRALHDLSNAAAGVQPGANGTVCMPFLAGEAAPGRRPDARAAYLGLSAHTTRDELFRATLEGTAFAIADIVDEVSGWCGEPEWIGLTGSGVLLTTWVDVIAAVLGRSLETTDSASEGRGVAMCCATALGVANDIHAAAAAMKPTPKYVRREDLEEEYRTLREAWQTTKRAMAGV